MLRSYRVPSCRVYGVGCMGMLCASSDVVVQFEVVIGDLNYTD